MLSQHLIQSFKLKQIVCVEYDRISEEQEREIFQVRVYLFCVTCGLTSEHSVYNWVLL